MANANCEINLLNFLSSFGEFDLIVKRNERILKDLSDTNLAKDLMQKSPFRTPDFLKSSPGGASAKFDSPQVRRIREEITPMPDYAEMLSPALRIELRRFGLKVIPRRNAVPLLRHIYEETHPQVRRKVEFDIQIIEENEERVMRLSGEKMINGFNFSISISTVKKPSKIVIKNLGGISTQHACRHPRQTLFMPHYL